MRKTLPTFYYLTHFHEFLGYFSAANACLLPAEVSRFISDFKKLNQAQQALLVRIANRKQPVVSIDSLQYSEIDNIQQQLTDLIQNNWLCTMEQAPIEDIANSLTKSALVDIVSKHQLDISPTNRSKSEIGEYFCNIVNGKIKASLADEPYVYRSFDHILQFLLFVYFGHLHGRLNQFSMRDLGVMRTRADAVSGEARFESPDDAQGAFYYASQQQLIKQNGIHVRSKLVPPKDLSLLPLVSSYEANQYRDHYLLTAGNAYLKAEQGKYREWALSALALSNADAAKEKWLREQYKDGHKDLVESCLIELIDTPSSENLLVFAEDFYARKYQKKRTSLLTDMLRNATKTLAIDSQYLQQVEQGVISQYRRLGIQAWHTENRLWRGLFGLVFWSIIFEQGQAGLKTEFERSPHTLKHNQFFTTHQQAIRQLLKTFTHKKVLLQHIKQQAARHYGKYNSLFHWHPAILEPIERLIRYAHLSQLLDQLLSMAKDIQGLKDGYPDLMVLEHNTLRFEEVKAPGDKLRRNQLVSLQCLQKNGFQVQISQVEWVRDPLQPYVVVDIETTGGGNSQHRITEIGMVKMIGTKIVDQWQSLINPQRHIPVSITRLTGIDDKMVASAPTFSEVAENIEQFTQDAIFVAHNVNFDYGFFKQEFERLGQFYRRPKLCTLQQMRRSHPGLPSYSLANLTTHFQIKMQQHHRAMSDALAAAKLLELILAKEHE